LCFSFIFLVFSFFLLEYVPGGSEAAVNDRHCNLTGSAYFPATGASALAVGMFGRWFWSAVAVLFPVHRRLPARSGGAYIVQPAL